jgi:hypothetical protein
MAKPKSREMPRYFYWTLVRSQKDVRMFQLDLLFQTRDFKT